jgi:RNA polymerase sigma factor (sigma-70 family)
MHPRPHLVRDDEPPTTTGGRFDADRFLVAAYEAHHAEVFAFLARATRDPILAEELLQDAFMRLIEQARAGRAPEQVRPWLYRVATNLVISRARRTRTARRWVDEHGVIELAARTVESPEAGVLRRERSDALGRALDGLAPDARAALLLSSEGFSGIEIADAIGRTHNATRSLLTRARITLREDLAGEVAS